MTHPSPANYERWIEQLSNALNTSIDIIQAIAMISTNERYMMDIWAQPTIDELTKIVRKVTGDGIIDPGLFHWDVYGNGWHRRITDLPGRLNTDQADTTDTSKT